MYALRDTQISGAAGTMTGGRKEGSIRRLATGSMECANVVTVNRGKL